MDDERDTDMAQTKMSIGPKWGLKNTSLFDEVGLVRPTPVSEAPVAATDPVTVDIREHPIERYRECGQLNDPTLAEGTDEEVRRRLHDAIVLGLKFNRVTHVVDHHDGGDRKGTVVEVEHPYENLFVLLGPNFSKGPRNRAVTVFTRDMFDRNLEGGRWSLASAKAPVVTPTTTPDTRSPEVDELTSAMTELKAARADLVLAEGRVASARTRVQKAKEAVMGLEV